MIIKRLAGRILATLGTLVVLAEAGTYYFYIYKLHQHYDPNVTILLIGSVLGFMGYYVQAPKRAMQAADFITTRVEHIMGGRRKDDPSDVVIAQKTEIIQPKDPNVRD